MRWLSRAVHNVLQSRINTNIDTNTYKLDTNATAAPKRVQARGCSTAGVACLSSKGGPQAKDAAKCNSILVTATYNLDRIGEIAEESKIKREDPSCYNQATLPLNYTAVVLVRSSLPVCESSP